MSVLRFRTIPNMLGCTYHLYIHKVTYQHVPSAHSCLRGDNTRFIYVSSTSIPIFKENHL